MTASRLPILVAIAATLAVAGCNRDRDRDPAPAKAPAATATASAASPMTYESKTPYAEVELALPAAIKTQPDLHGALYAEEVRSLRQFAEGAQGERTEAGSPTDMPPYSKAIAVTVAADTARLLSLKREDFDYSGGAHPNTLQSGILWDKTLKRRLTSADIFAKGADLSVLDQALCSAINTAKRERSPDAVNLTLGGGDDWNCPRAGSTPFVLARGSEAGKAGGLTFLIDPYQVGPYVEGAYEIDLPLAVFRQLLAREYAGEFGGALTKTAAGPA